MKVSSHCTKFINGMLCIMLVVLLTGCGATTPAGSDVLGRWTAANGTVLTFTSAELMYFKTTKGGAFLCYRIANSALEIWMPDLGTIQANGSRWTYPFTQSGETLSTAIDGSSQTYTRVNRSTAVDPGDLDPFDTPTNLHCLRR